MKLYFDSAYIAKCYLNEAHGEEVRRVARSASALYSSALCIAEIACVFHRHVREGSLTGDVAAALRKLFLEDVENEVWALIPISKKLLYRVELLTRTLPPSAYLRAGDAIHLVAAAEYGFHDIWTNDRHLAAAAGYLGLKGRTIDS